jgi:hypothetical protein
VVILLPASIASRATPDGSFFRLLETRLFVLLAGQILQTSDDQRRPSGSEGTQSTAGVAMKVFVKQHQVAPVRVFGKAAIFVMARTAAVPCGPGIVTANLTAGLAAIIPIANRTSVTPKIPPTNWANT